MPWHFAAEIPSQYFIGCFTRFSLEELAGGVSECPAHSVVEQAARGLHFLLAATWLFAELEWFSVRA